MYGLRGDSECSETWHKDCILIGEIVIGEHALLAVNVGTMALIQNQRSGMLPNLVKLTVPKSVTLIDKP